MFVEMWHKHRVVYNWIIPNRGIVRLFHTIKMLSLMTRSGLSDTIWFNRQKIDILVRCSTIAIYMYTYVVQSSKQDFTNATKFKYIKNIQNICFRFFNKAKLTFKHRTDRTLVSLNETLIKIVFRHLLVVWFSSWTFTLHVNTSAI